MGSSATTVCKLFEAGLITKEEARYALGLDAPNPAALEKIAALGDFKQYNEAHASWFDACCDANPTLFVERGDVYKSYVAWSEGAGKVVSSRTSLFAYLRKLGAVEKRTAEKRYFAGFGLKPKEEGGNPQ